MKPVYFLSLFFSFIACSEHTRSEPPKDHINYSTLGSDSLKVLVNSAIDDTAKADIQLILSDRFDSVSNDQVKAFQLAFSALNLSKAIDYRSGTGRSLLQIGKLYYSRQEYDKALTNLNQAMSIVQSTGDKKMIANLLVMIGDSYLSLKNHDLGLLYLQKGVDNIKEMKDDKETNAYLSECTLICKRTGNFNDTLLFQQKESLPEKKVIH